MKIGITTTAVLLLFLLFTGCSERSLNKETTLATLGLKGNVRSVKHIKESTLGLVSDCEYSFTRSGMLSSKVCFNGKTPVTTSYIYNSSNLLTKESNDFYTKDYTWYDELLGSTILRSSDNLLEVSYLYFANGFLASELVVSNSDTLFRWIYEYDSVDSTLKSKTSLDFKTGDTLVIIDAQDVANNNLRVNEVCYFRNLDLESRDLVSRNAFGDTINFQTIKDDTLVVFSRNNVYTYDSANNWINNISDIVSGNVSDCIVETRIIDYYKD